MSLAMNSQTIYITDCPFYEIQHLNNGLLHYGKDYSHARCDPNNSRLAVL